MRQAIKIFLLIIMGGFLLLAGALLLPFVLGICALFFPLLAAAFAILGTIFWIWMLIDCIKNQGLSETEKIVWVLAIVFTHFIGATIYFFAGRGRTRLVNP